jgi:hypothetical protein
VGTLESFSILEEVVQGVIEYSKSRCKECAGESFNIKTQGDLSARSAQSQHTVEVLVKL